jgi:hypothetical protein
VGVRSFGPSVGYHGCEQALVDEVLDSGKQLEQSTNVYDWLGHGVYFWLDSPERALQWARQTKKKKPAVLGAVINPGFCLNLADVNQSISIKSAYSLLAQNAKSLGVEMPANQSPDRQGLLLKRTLDCSVIELVHALRKRDGVEAFDSVIGVFEEGAPMFPGAAMKERTHVQIAVRNQASILGYFRPRF